LEGICRSLRRLFQRHWNELKEFIARHPAAQGFEPYIYSWPGIAAYGIRVAEIGLTKGRGGLAYMQSDPNGAVVGFFAERLALECEDGGDDEDAKNEIADASGIWPTRSLASDEIGLLGMHPDNVRWIR